jgi:hypothetical protein
MRLAKRGQLSKSELYSRMLTASKVFQTIGVSEAQAFAKFVATDEGRELFQIHGSLPGRDYEPSWQNPVTKHAGGSTWDDLVKAVSKSQNISYSRAVDECLKTPEGKVAFNMQRRHEKIHASGYTVADMQMDDAIAKAQDANSVPGISYPSEYEVAVNNTLRNNPTLTRSQAHDHVRTTRPDLWDAFSKLGGTGKQLPRSHIPQPGEENPQAATSMRNDPYPGPQWRSAHSGSPPNTPARTPERMSNEPQIKWFDRQAPRARDWYVNYLAKYMSPDRAVDVLKRW